MPLTKYPANAEHAIRGSCLLIVAAPDWTAMGHQVTRRICSRVELHFQCMHIYVRTCVYARVCLCVILQSRKHQFILFILSVLKKSDFVTENTYFLKRNIEGLQKLLRYKKGVCVCVCICVSLYIYICILTRNSDSTEEIPTPVFCKFTPHGSLGFGFVTKSLRSVHGT